MRMTDPQSYLSGYIRARYIASIYLYVAQIHLRFHYLINVREKMEARCGLKAKKNKDKTHICYRSGITRAKAYFLFTPLCIAPSLHGEKLSISSRRVTIGLGPRVSTNSRFERRPYGRSTPTWLRIGENAMESFALCDYGA